MDAPDEDGYLRYIADADSREKSNGETFDKALLTLSSALLGVSLTFTNNAVPLATAEFIGLLIAAWALFALTIVLVIGSIIYGQRCFKVLKDNARRFYLDGDRSANELSENISASIRRFNTATGVCFILGVVFFTAFVGTNVIGINEMSKDKGQSREERGLPASTYQQQQSKPQSGSGQTEQGQQGQQSDPKK